MPSYIISIIISLNPLLSKVDSDNLLRLNNTQSLKPIVVTKLIGPRTSHDVIPTFYILISLSPCVCCGGDIIDAGSGFTTVVDGEGIVTGFLCIVAGSCEGLNRPVVCSWHQWRGGGEGEEGEWDEG